MTYDFGGYATRNDLKCSDGRTIRRDAFKSDDGKTVPLVWHHLRNDPSNVLGHALLENREDGVYAYCSFNNTPKAKTAKMLVEHGDVQALSIYANNLMQKSGNVMHGAIKEVSLVVAGANPGAFIDNVSIQHSDGSIEDVEDEACIYHGEEGLIDWEQDGIEHADKPEPKEKEETKVPSENTTSSGKTMKEIYNSMNEEQKQFTAAVVAYALDNASDMDDDDDAEHSDIYDDEGDEMMHTNVFESQNDIGPALTHEDVEGIFSAAKKYGSLKDAVNDFSLEHGIDNIDVLFPEAQNITPTPEMIMRQQDWVPKVWNAVRKSPFARIKSTAADLTESEARAKGYITGHKKVDEQIKLMKRVTTPQTVYKRQKLDRDDIVDITTMDVVAWIKAEMRLMLNEELARAIMIGDGRNASDEDKISEDHIRPIWTEAELYATHYNVTLTNDLDADAFEILKANNMARIGYEGSGSPTLYTGSETVAKLLLARDKNGLMLYNGVGQLAQALRVKEIVEIPLMDNCYRTNEDGERVKLVGIVVNLSDYVVGSDRGGAVSMFDDFDIDYNQYKYLIETRCSGALHKPHSAIVLESKTEEKPVPEIIVSAPAISAKEVGVANGPVIGTMQSDVQIGSDFIAGKLKYQGDAKWFGSNAEQQSGYYLTVKVEAKPAEAKIKVYSTVDGTPKEVNDGAVVLRVTDPSKQRLKLTAEKDDVVATRVLNLRNIYLD